MKAHPLTLVVVALWFSTAALFVPRLDILAAVMLLSLLWAMLLKAIQVRVLLRQLRYFLPLFVSILLIQALFVKQGTIMLGKGWYAVHTVAVNTGVAFCLRLLSLWFSAQALIRLTYEDFELAFSRLGLPEELSFMVSYAVGIIPAVSRRVGHYRQLLLLRGIDLARQRWRQKLDIYRLISLTLLAEVLSRSGIQAISLELRGFRSSGKRSRLRTQRLSWLDAFLLFLLAVMTAGYFIL